MRIIREVQNAIDGNYTVRDSNDEKKQEKQLGSGFREGESRIVRKLIDLGLAIPQNDEAKSKKRG